MSSSEVGISVETKVQPVLVPRLPDLFHPSLETNVWASGFVYYSEPSPKLFPVPLDFVIPWL